MSVILGITMATSAIGSSLVGVLGPFFRSELGLTVGRLGLLVTVFSASAGVLSIPAGTFTDKVGGRRATLLVLLTSLASLLVLAIAPSWAWLVVAMLIAGVANSAANPATNHVITTSLAPYRHGLAAGFKMACVQVAIVSAGLLLPPLAAWIGWRIPLIVGSVIVTAVGVALLVSVLGTSEPPASSRRSGRRLEQRRDLLWLTAYALLMSAGASAVLTYLAVYTVEALGSTPQVGGAAVAVAGTMGILGRLGLGRATGGRTQPLGLLAAVGVVAVVSTILLSNAGGVATLPYWLGIIGLGLSANSFVAGATVALIVTVSRDQIGGASGIMFLGTLIGFGLGPAVFGQLAESSGYGQAWTLTAIVFGAGAVVAMIGGRRPGSPQNSTSGGP